MLREWDFPQHGLMMVGARQSARMGGVKRMVWSPIAAPVGNGRLFFVGWWWLEGRARRLEGNGRPFFGKSWPTASPLR
ncbi:MAG: hypothetical protein H6667_16265 [Ardenticatenaceae bacterium]|nr:hypothetical protein [Ardenticatenaceae bacterium]